MNIRLLYRFSSVSLFIKSLSALLLILIFPARAAEIQIIPVDTFPQELLVSELSEAGRPNPILQFVKQRQKKNRQITAAVLAFPFPFGIVGLHRIYLGTAPHVPIVYIGTLGGIFGVLPFIDFCILVLDKNVDRYADNKKVFMWIE